jgi:hypothetical protein
MENMVKSFFGIRVAKENFSSEDGNTNPLGGSSLVENHLENYLLITWLWLDMHT